MQIPSMAFIGAGMRISVLAVGLCLLSTAHAELANNSKLTIGDLKIPDSVSSSHLVQHRMLQECVQRERSRQREAGVIADVSQACRNELAVLRDNLPPDAVNTLASVERDNLRRDQERSSEHRATAQERSARAEQSREQRASRESRTVANFKSLSKCQRAARLQEDSASERRADSVDCVAQLGLTDIEVADIQSYLREAAGQ